MNFGDAVNMGVEVDVMKYFNWFGFKANYTYTHSRMTTAKYQMEGSEIVSRLQTRPLFGQAAKSPTSRFCSRTESAALRVRFQEVTRASG